MLYGKITSRSAVEAAPLGPWWLAALIDLLTQLSKVAVLLTVAYRNVTSVRKEQLTNTVDLDYPIPDDVRIWTYIDASSQSYRPKKESASLVMVASGNITLELMSTRRFKTVGLDCISPDDIEYLEHAYPDFDVMKEIKDWCWTYKGPRRSLRRSRTVKDDVTELAAEFEMKRSSVRWWRREYKKACAAGIRKREAEKRRLENIARGAEALLQEMENAE